MAKLEDVAAALTAIGTGIDGISTEVSKVSTESTAMVQSIADLKAQIAAGTPVDQAAIDALAAQAQGIADKVAALSASVQAVDDLVPDAPPAAPPAA